MECRIAFHDRWIVHPHKEIHLLFQAIQYSKVTCKLREYLLDSHKLAISIIATVDLSHSASGYGLLLNSIIS